MTASPSKKSPIFRLGKTGLIRDDKRRRHTTNLRQGGWVFHKNGMSKHLNQIPSANFEMRQKNMTRCHCFGSYLTATYSTVPHYKMAHFQFHGLMLPGRTTERQICSDLQEMSLHVLRPDGSHQEQICKSHIHYPKPNSFHFSVPATLLLQAYANCHREWHWPHHRCDPSKFPSCQGLGN